MILTLDEITDSYFWVGNKAASLAKLYHAQLPVPKAIVITTSFFDKLKKKSGIESLLSSLKDNLALQSEIQHRIIDTSFDEDSALMIFQLCHEYLHDCPVAIRSSGSKEDMDSASFAGLYDSFLNISGHDNILLYIKKCIASTYNQRTLAYCLQHDIDFDSLKTAVIIQESIRSEASGVVFTVHPVTGKDTEMLIEAILGLGEHLVSGHVTPDQYIYNWYDMVEVKREISEKKHCIIPINDSDNQCQFTRLSEIPNEKKKVDVLTSDQVKQLVLHSLKVQALYGQPQDIEWALCNNSFYLLQSRPITKISFEGIQDEWTTADLKDGGVSSKVCTPFMASLYDYIFERNMSQYFHQTHLVLDFEPTDYMQVFFARPYWNAGYIKQCLMALPGFVERNFDRDLGIEITYDGKGRTSKTTVTSLLKGLKVLSALEQSFYERIENNKHLVTLFEQRLSELESLDYHKMKHSEFFLFYESLLFKDYQDFESAYFLTIYDNSNIKSLFSDFFQKIQKKQKKTLNYLSLIGGLENLSHLRPVYEMWDLVKQIYQDQQAVSFFLHSDTDSLAQNYHKNIDYPFKQEIENYIKKYGYHSEAELDISIPRFREDPRMLFENLKNTITHFETLENPRDLTNKQILQYAKEKENIEKLLKENIFEKALQRERKKFIKLLHTLRTFLWWREEMRDYSSRMYYHIRMATLSAGDRFYKLKVIEDPLDIFYASFHSIIDRCKQKISQEDFNKIITKNKLYYKSFINFQNPNEIGKKHIQQRKDYKNTSKIFNGIGCSPGCVTGKAKVIVNIQDIGNLLQDDILVTRFTDPGWTPVFSRLKAVVTETGGILSHAAVISREYGIPAVLAVSNVTSFIKSGQTITVNGSEGIVSLEK